MDENVCWGCVGDSIVAAEIKKDGSRAKCDYCGKLRKCLPLDWLAERVHEVLSRLIRIGDVDAVFDSDGDVSHYETAGDSLEFWVSEVLVIGDETDPLVQAVCEELYPSHHEILDGDEGEFPFDTNFVAVRRRPWKIEHRWKNFKNEIMHGRRFFSSEAKPFLDWLFRDAESFRSYTLLGGNRSVVRLLDIGTTFYRARRCDNVSAVRKVIGNPAKEMGAPPRELAGAGRMNPAGVPFFYGAFDRDTCIAELRPPVGGSVVSCQFQLSRPVRIFDFTSLEDTYVHGALSYFDEQYHEEIQRKHFLRSLHATISSPVLPNNENDYLVTQVIAEYFATQFPSEIGGVIFSSAQRQGEDDEAQNIVLFPASLSAIELNKDELQVHEMKAVRYVDKVSDVIGGRVMHDFDEYESEWDFDDSDLFEEIGADPLPGDL